MSEQYCLPLSNVPDASVAVRAIDLVWRYNFDAPGFCSLEVPPVIDSHTLRAWMVELKERLSAVLAERTGQRFLFRSMARFDQQVTTKHHLDGAPEQSMLMLGYEPSIVHSRLFLADYTRAAFDLGITAHAFLQDYNPMFRAGEEILNRYATELPVMQAGHSRILLINNSSLSYSPNVANPLGVMHKAVIVTPRESERRVINSTMLVTQGEELDAAQQAEFIQTTKISKKAY
jgi:hypothetical protein